MSVEVLKRVRGVSAVSVQQLFTEARAGSREALGQLFQLCTPYLVSVARKELPVALHAKLDAEDVVQQTFLDAHIAFRRFQGCTRYRLVHWLRSILIHNLRDAVRRYKFTDKRCVGREVSLEGTLRIRRFELPTAAPGPCDCAARTEDEQSLANAFATLPQRYRTVIQRHHFEFLSFVEIARRSDHSPDAIRKLEMRAIRVLSGRMRRSCV